MTPIYNIHVYKKVVPKNPVSNRSALVRTEDWTGSRIQWILKDRGFQSLGMSQYTYTVLTVHLYNGNPHACIVLAIKLEAESLQWRHNERDGVSNHQNHGCSFNRFFQGADQKTIKAPRHWALWGEFTGDRWIPRTKDQERGTCFHLMTSSCVNDDSEEFYLVIMVFFMSYLSLLSLSFPVHDGSPAQCPMSCQRFLSYSSEDISGAQPPKFVKNINEKPCKQFVII